MGAATEEKSQTVREQVVKIPDYDPSERQKLFHKSKSFESLYGGAAGGGKSVALCAQAITEALKRPNTHVFIFRRTLKELMLSIHPEIIRQLAPYQSVPDHYKPTTISYDSQRSVFKCSNGSFIQLAYLDTIADRYRYMSAEIHILLIDELTHFHYDDYEYLRTRVRSGEERPLKIMCATNPGNVGHGWVKQYFGLPDGIVDENILTEVIDPYTQEKTGDTRLFVPAKVDDNPSATFKKTYKRTLNAIQDENLRRAQLFGDWSVFQGQVFLEWHRHNPVLPDDELPIDLDTCERYIGFDWGFNDPACAIWLAVAPEDERGVKHIYAYREMYQGNTTPEAWAEKIAEAIRWEPVEFMVLPHDCYSHLGGNKTIAMTFMEHDIPVKRADSLSHAAKMNRIALMHQVLAPQNDRKPLLQIHKSCLNLIRTIPDLPYSETKAEEIDDKAEDHAYDALTYGLMVVLEGKTYVVSPKRPIPGIKGGYMVEDGQLKDFHIDISSALKNSSRIGEREWQYR